MCRKFIVSITVLVLASLMLTTITDASISYDRKKDTKSLCKINQQKASQVAAKAATAATAAMDTKISAEKANSQQMQLELADHAQQAAKTATDILAGKQHQLEILVKRLADNHKAIDAGNKAVALTMCTLKRVLWIRDTTRQGLENLMYMYNESNGNQGDIKYLAAFAHQEEAEKTQLMEAAMSRLDDLKSSMQRVKAELKTIRQSAKEANNAAEEARQRIEMLTKLVPKIKMLKPKDLQTVNEFLLKHRRASKHIKHST
ncbi:hypothetical protein KR032_009797 [Drosophila birchii]|nr:hypothetical protein KR032_009797 [Drosophila birchii]